MNGDGYADVIVGAPGTRATPAGRTSTTAAPTGVVTPAAATLDGETAATASSAPPSPAPATSTATGTPTSSSARTGHGGSTGRAYVYAGGASGVGTPAASTLTGRAAGNQFGASVAGAGDVNGDGYADIVVGAPGYNTDIGRAYVHHGGASGTSASPSTTLTGEATGHLFGGAVSPAGDVNGDGFADVIVAARGYSGSTGRAYVHDGGAGRREHVARHNADRSGGG